MKKIAIAFAVIVLVIVTFISWKAWRLPEPNILALGNFVVISLTLIVLVWYAYDTNRIARVTEARWIREGVLGTTYSLQLVDKKGQSGKTLVQLNNPSTLLVRARVAFNFQVYGESVTAGALYDGNEVWLLFPQQMSQGWFEIETLLRMKGKTVAMLISEYTSEKRKLQLSMRLKLEFWDELGGRRELPPRQHYFDFERWAWIPQLAEND